MSEVRRVVLTGAQIVELVAEYAARQDGVPRACRHWGSWRMVDGQIELELSIEVLDNVRQLDTVRLGKRQAP